jgi:putative DNA primase/helicase
MSYENLRTYIANKCEGRWDSILPQLSSDPRIDSLFTKKTNVTCPVCDKARKFYMIDTSTAKSKCCSTECNKCFWDGISLAHELGNFSRENEVVRRLEEILSTEIQHDQDYLRIKEESGFKNKGKKFIQKPSDIQVSAPPAKKVTEPKINEYALKMRNFLLSSLLDINHPDAELARRYIKSRGLDVNSLMNDINGRIFFHPNLSYYHQVLDSQDKVIETISCKLPCIVLKLYGHHKKLVGFHRIYLNPETGEKADVPEAKKLLSPLFEGDYAAHGCIVPFGQTTNEIGICEGVETGMALLSLGKHCWPLIDAYKFLNFNPPIGTEVLNVYGDLDASNTGQNVCIKLYEKLRESRPEIEVNIYLPPVNYWNKSKFPKGIDFLDIYLMGFKFEY